MITRTNCIALVRPLAEKERRQPHAPIPDPEVERERRRAAAHRMRTALAARVGAQRRQEA